jgi:predicted  nucleic acid-binding Zn-ribbon protein
VGSPTEDTDVASNITIPTETGLANRTDGRSNSTVMHDTSSNYSPDISEDISASFSPVRTSRENSMSEGFSDDHSSYLNLKHKIDVVDLDDPECQKTALKYLLHKVQHNENLVVAVVKEYNNVTDDLNKLYSLNDNLAAENITLKNEIESQKMKISKLSLKKDMEDLKSVLAEEKELIFNVLEKVVSERESESAELKQTLTEEISEMKEEIHAAKETCRDDKDDISNALVTDLHEIKSWLDVEVENIRETMKSYRDESIVDEGKVVDQGDARELNSIKHTMATSSKIFQQQVGDAKKEIQNLREEVKESLHRSSSNQIRIENVNIELSEEVDQLVRKMVDLEKEVQKTNQYGRRPNLVIDGIPDRVPQHHLEGICLDLIQKLGINNVTCLEVEGCHRLRKREGDRSSPTIIRFTNRKISELCKRNKWKLKKLRYNNWFLSFREDLNEANNEIYTKCEELKSKGLLTKVYTHNGFTKVVKNEGDWARNIFHMKDLFDLVNVDDSVKPDSPNIINFQTVDDVQTWLNEPKNVYVGRGEDNIPCSEFCNRHKIQGNVTRAVALKRFEDDVMNNAELRDEIKKQLKGKTLGCHCSPLHCHAEILHRIAGNHPIYQKTNNHPGKMSSNH